MLKKMLRYFDAIVSLRQDELDDSVLFINREKVSVAEKKRRAASKNGQAAR